MQFIVPDFSQNNLAEHPEQVPVQEISSRIQKANITLSN